MTQLLTKQMLKDLGIYNVYYDIENETWWVDKCITQKRTGNVLHTHIKPHIVTCKHKYTQDKKYYAYTWYDGSGYRTISAARLIYAWFHDVVPEGMDVEHIDNNPFNNSLNNLELATREDNLKKRYKDNPDNHHNQYN